MTSPEWEAANEDDSDRFPQTPHASASESTESHEQGSRIVPEPDRVARYAEALDVAASAHYVPLGEDDSCVCGGVWSGLHYRDGLVEAMVAVADEERAALVAEVERLKRGGKTLGEIIDKQCQMVLDATGLHDWVDEDGDGDWGAIWDHLFALRSRAESAEAALAVARAQVEAVRALADELEANRSASWPYAFKRLRAALSSADAPAEQRNLNCPVCGNGEEGACICALAEQIAEAEWNASGLAVREGPWAVVSIIKRRSLIIKALPEAAESIAAEGDGRG